MDEYQMDQDISFLHRKSSKQVWYCHWLTLLETRQGFSGNKHMILQIPMRTITFIETHKKVRTDNIKIMYKSCKVVVPSSQMLHTKYLLNIRIF